MVEEVLALLVAAGITELVTAILRAIFGADWKEQLASFVVGALA